MALAARILFGSGGPSSQGPTFIRSLPNQQIQGQRDAILSVTTGADEAVFWACPVSFGTPEFRLGGTFLLGGMRHVGDWDITIGGETDAYQLWASNQLGLGSVAPIEIRTS